MLNDDPFVSGTNAFALDLYARLAAGDGNVWCSPMSIALALTMLEAGARGETLAEIRAVLHRDAPGYATLVAARELDRALAREQPLPRGATGEPLRLGLANSLWIQDGIAVEPAFRSELERELGAGVFPTDFARRTEASRTEINAWVAEHTNGRITELLRRGAVADLTRLVVVNAVYFKGSWARPFDPSRTRSREFTTLAGQSVTVPMVSRQGSYAYATADGWQAVDVPYLGAASMTIVVPDAGRFAEVERSITTHRLSEVFHALAARPVELTMPRLDLRSGIDLGGALRELGMTSAFGDVADFSGITTAERVWIGALVHQATLLLDERGSEATAATAAMVAAGVPAEPAEPVVLTIDRPYLLLVRDGPTGALLFLGRVVDPR